MAALGQWFSTVGSFWCCIWWCPQTSLDLITGECYWPKRLLNTLQGTGQPPQWRVIRPHMLAVQRPRDASSSFRVFCAAFWGPSLSLQDSRSELCGPSLSPLSLNLFWHESVHKFWNYTAWISFSVLSICVILGTSFNFSERTFPYLYKRKCTLLGGLNELVPVNPLP